MNPKVMLLGLLITLIGLAGVFLIHISNISIMNFEQLISVIITIIAYVLVTGVGIIILMLGVGLK